MYRDKTKTSKMMTKTKILTKNFEPVDGIITVRAQRLGEEYTCWCKAEDYTFEFKEGMSTKDIIEQTIKLLSVMP
jgi:hypothetical protein